MAASPLKISSRIFRPSLPRSRRNKRSKTLRCVLIMPLYYLSHIFSPDAAAAARHRAATLGQTPVPQMPTAALETQFKGEYMPRFIFLIFRGWILMRWGVWMGEQLCEVELRGKNPSGQRNKEFNCQRAVGQRVCLRRIFIFQVEKNARSS